MPKTSLGKWSIRLIVAFFLLLVTGNFIVSQQGPRGRSQTFFDDPLLSIPMLGAGTAAILAFFAGAISIIKNKERSVFVYIAAAIGFLVLDFVLGEILFPH